MDPMKLEMKPNCVFKYNNYRMDDRYDAKYMLIFFAVVKTFLFSKFAPCFNSFCLSFLINTLNTPHSQNGFCCPKYSKNKNNIVYVDVPVDFTIKKAILINVLYSPKVIAIKFNINDMIQYFQNWNTKPK